MIVDSQVAFKPHDLRAVRSRSIEYPPHRAAPDSQCRQARSKVSLAVWRRCPAVPSGRSQTFDIAALLFLVCTFFGSSYLKPEMSIAARV